MSRRLLAALALGFAAPLAAQQAPSTDVWIAPMSVKDGIVTIGEPISVSNRSGYDNQPSFSSDGRRLYYTTQRNGQTDLIRFDVRRRTTKPFTETPESEYSPAVIPGSSDVAAIVVERDSTQRLWRISENGTRTVLLPALKPVGYHAWATDRQVLAFVLGNDARGEANALVLADIRTNKVDTLARGIGRALGRQPLTGALTFTQRAPNGSILVRQVNPATRAVSDLMPGLPNGSEYYAWSPGGRLFMAVGTTIAQRTGTSEWTSAATFRDPRIGTITRLAISPKGEWIAFVAEEAPTQTRKEWTDVAVPVPTPGARELDSTYRLPKKVDDMILPPDTVTKKPYTGIAVPIDASGNPVLPTDVPPRPAADRGAIATTTAPAQTLTVIVVRHAEKATGTGDVPLSTAGVARAADLADALRHANVRAVFTSPLTRTRQTGEPTATASALALQPISLDGGTAAHAKRVAEAVLKVGGGTVLVVGHSNTVPAILAALGAPSLPDLCESSYDNLFVLTIPPSGPRALVRGTYGAPTPSDDACKTMEP